MTFRDFNLNKQLLNALDDLGITKPTVIQEKVFSVVMSGKDLCGIAQTGTGKTFAYLLPCLRLLKYSEDKLPQLMIVVPTRELVVQVVEEVKKLIKYSSYTVVGVYGGTNLKPQAAEVAKGLDIIVGTPGRLMDLLSTGVLRPKTIKKVVIDEFDEMLNLGFRAQVKQIFDRLPARRQNMLFSATINSDVEKLLGDYFVDLVHVEATPTGTPLVNINQSYYEVPNFYTKINLLKYLLKEHQEMSKVLVFTSSKKWADAVYAEFDAEQDKINVIHSNKSQNYRLNAVAEFHENKTRTLIATDIIARGIDVAEVTHVINFDLPEVADTYMHRIGRSGRAERKGEAISFVSEKQKEELVAIEALMNMSIPQLALPEGLAISEKIADLEVEKAPVTPMKIIEIRDFARDNAGPAFHEKSAKNKKVNIRRDREAEKKKKYGRSYKSR